MAAPHVPSVTTSLQGVVPVIAPIGDFDLASLHLLREPVLEAVSQCGRVILDLSGTTFVDSMVLGLLVEGSKRAAEAGGWLRVASPRSNVHRILVLMALDTVIGVYPSVEAAAVEGVVAEGAGA